MCERSREREREREKERRKPSLHRMEEEQQLRREKQLYLFNTAPLPLIPPLSLPLNEPLTPPFLTLPLSQSSMARGYSVHTHTQITICARVRDTTGVRPLFSPRRTCTDRMHVLLNIHQLTKNRRDIVSSGNVPFPLRFQNPSNSTLFIRF